VEQRVQAAVRCGARWGEAGLEMVGEGGELRLEARAAAPRRVAP
jgi:hypothetical protein